MINAEMSKSHVHVIGAGLAGSEAAWQLAQAGFGVLLHEMRPHTMTPAHQTGYCAELVCSNSLRSDDSEHNAVGLLHDELRKMNSLIMQAADNTRVPAGSALAVDREQFSQFITQKLTDHPLIERTFGEYKALPEDDRPTIIATGPLTSDSLSQDIIRVAGEKSLSFFDAIAPIIYKDSIDMSKAWFQSRYDKGDGNDYINCPLNQEQYQTFIEALIDGEKMDFHTWEKDTPYFEGCLPIEVMAQRGPQTLRFGPMKPVGLTNAHARDIKPWAIVQLRQDNALGTLWNMVGFQTKLKYGEQKRIFQTIPGLEEAQFARLGGIHRNSFLNSRMILDDTLSLKNRPSIRFAGQMTGVEGYVESTASGLLAALFTSRSLQQKAQSSPPETTALGALLGHVTQNAMENNFQPMNINFGLFPPPQLPDGCKKMKGRDRKLALTTKAKADMDHWQTTL